MADEELRPLAIEVEGQAALRIRWGNGQTVVLPLEVVRGACPCAACRTERERSSRSALPVVRPAEEQAEMVRVVEMSLVGHYALRIRWADGHDTGMYDFRLLQALGERGAQ